jgi:enamine deaminase RidA (YjgF/YER057c/UK114 family)
MEDAARVAESGGDAVGSRHADGDVRGGPLTDLLQRLHARDANRVRRERISSGAAFEKRVGYSRAIVADGHVWVSGTAPIMPGDVDPPADAYGQARRCLEIVATALAEAGGSLDDVVRTRIYVTSAEVIDEVGRAHREAFAAAKPATTAVVTGLLDPRWLVEIEAEALLDTHAAG